MMQVLKTHIKIMEAMDTTADTQIILAKEDAVRNAEKFGEAYVESVSTVIWHINIGPM